MTLSTTAYIGITDADIAGTGAAATFRVYVTDVVPSVKVGLFDFTLRGFVKKLLQAGLTQFVQDHVPALTVPLETKIPLRFPAHGSGALNPNTARWRQSIDGSFAERRTKPGLCPETEAPAVPS